MTKVFLAVLAASFATMAQAQYKSTDEMYQQMYQVILEDELLFHSDIEVCLHDKCVTYPALSKSQRVDEDDKIESQGNGVDFPVAKTDPLPPVVDDFQIARAIASVIEAITSKGDIGGALEVTHENNETTGADGSFTRGTKTTVRISGGTGGSAKSAAGSMQGGGSKEHHSQLH